MIGTRYTSALLGLAVLLVEGNASAQIHAPVVKSIVPHGASAGQTVKLTIGGNDLDRGSEIVIEAMRSIPSTIQKATPTAIEATLTLPADIPTGPISVRVLTPRGISNALRFDVSRSGQNIVEVEPNDDFRKPQVVKSPCTVEGRISKGMDVDLFAVDLHAGETIVAEVIAARVGSSLDALVTIFDPDGRELASDDDLFGRDAAAWVKVLRDGRYAIEVVDANGRSADGKAEAALQDNRFYRLTIGTVSLLIAVDPPGARRGKPSPMRLLGVNLPKQTTFDIPADTPTGDFLFGVAGSNRSNVRISDDPEVRESEPDDLPERAITVSIPAAINGRFDRKAGGDVDFYRIKPTDGRAGDYAITAFAARVGSPADPVVSLIGDDGKSLAEDDDKLGRDARLERRIEPNGLLLGVREFYGRGGERFLYRIEIEPLAPLTVKVGLDGRTVPRKGRIALPIEVERHGFNGPVTILTGPLPQGVSAPPTTIPASAGRGWVILSATDDAKLGAFPLRLIARDVPGRVEWPGLSPNRREPLFAVAEPASLDLAVEPREIVVAAGSEAEITIKLSRGPDAIKSSVMLTFTTDAPGLEALKEQSIAAGADHATIRLKARSDSSPGRLSLLARARLDGSTEAESVAAIPIAIEVRPKAK
jgi:hypothetical protein